MGPTLLTFAAGMAFQLILLPLVDALITWGEKRSQLRREFREYLHLRDSMSQVDDHVAAASQQMQKHRSW